MVRLENLQGKTVCVAVSGGVDSVCLLHYLNEKKSDYDYRLCAVNFEHGLRGEESVADSRFVAELCARWEIPLYAYSADCARLATEQKTGLEETARNFRAGVYQRLIKEGNADVIATAHHADDNAETVIFRLARGASLTGARGIEETTPTFIRPFADKTKEELYAYAKAHSLSYCEDATNAEPITPRNRIRAEVLPVLEECVSGAKNNLLRFSKIAEEDDALLYRLSRPYVKKNEPSFLGDSGYAVCYCEEQPLFRRAALLVLKEIGIENDYSYALLDELYRLQFSQTGAKTSLPKGWTAQKEYDKLRFVQPTKKGCEKGLESPFFLGERETDEYRVEVRLSGEKTPNKEENAWGRVLTADFDKFPKTAKIRLKREGDVFEKFGGGTKPLKKYLVDKKIAATVRGGLPIVADGDKVYAVFGVEISKKVGVDENTKRVCELILSKK